MGPGLILQRGLQTGLVRSRWAAPVGSIDAQEITEYDSVKFNGEDAPCECYVCLQEFGSSMEIRRTTCGHYFHGECLSTWLRMASTCPTCRADLSGIPLPLVTAFAPVAEHDRNGVEHMVVGVPQQENVET